MTSTGLSLSKKSLLLLFAYLPAGLGHLRVTEALYNGLPPHTSPLLLGSQDKTITIAHRIMSIHPVTRALFEWLEQGVAEELTTPIYRWYLRYHTELLYQQINTIVDQRITIPEEILLVATHYGLAHQAAAIKDRIIRERKINMRIVVQVTDDFPHHIWYVPRADIIFVPSERTKSRLEAYGRRKNLPETRIEVNPYPLSPNLSTPLTEDRMTHRTSQLNPHHDSTIHMAFPISGAAVGTRFTTRLIDKLHLFSSRFKFHVITKNAPFTFSFINDIYNRAYTDILASSHDLEVIKLYEELYKTVTISLEVTKPSEQAFKALICPKKRGGAIMLFSDPVGRQEYDNLSFLRRHQLLPPKSLQHTLWKWAKNDLELDEKEKKSLQKEARSWRGIRLPKGSHDASRFIWWCHKEKVFSSMLSCTRPAKDDTSDAFELSEHGVSLFWDKVAQTLVSPA